jgi:hypothetical protein
MSDNPDRNMCEECKLVFTDNNLEIRWQHFRRQMSHLSVKTKIDSYFSPGLLLRVTGFSDFVHRPAF